MNKTMAGGVAAVIVSLTTAAACGGGGSSTSTTPTSPTTPGTGGNPQTATITIGSDGRVSPSSVTIAPGGRVMFINNHNRPHEVSSDPHPDHTDCPSINDAGFLQPGQSRQTGNLNTVRTCRFHDHNDFENTNLQGSIIVQ